MRVKGQLVVIWICSSLMTRDVEHLSRAYWPFADLLWRNSIQMLCPLFSWGIQVSFNTSRAIETTIIVTPRRKPCACLYTGLCTSGWADLPFNSYHPECLLFSRLGEAFLVIILWPRSDIWPHCRGPESAIAAHGREHGPGSWPARLIPQPGRWEQPSSPFPPLRGGIDNAFLAELLVGFAESRHIGTVAHRA